ncbi:MAG: hypothetical protein KDA89_22410 [Planctomycetaceae bacterium]|nr:hypothetical protein [Planctomycetaceae bacterium]
MTEPNVGDPFKLTEPMHGTRISPVVTTVTDTDVPSRTPTVSDDAGYLCLTESGGG